MAGVTERVALSDILFSGIASKPRLALTDAIEHLRGVPTCPTILYCRSITSMA
jgi:hypothetical protein